MSRLDRDTELSCYCTAGSVYLTEAGRLLQSFWINVYLRDAINLMFL